MKKLTTLTFLCVLLCGCGENEVQKSTTKTYTITIDMLGSIYRMAYNDGVENARLTAKRTHVSTQTRNNIHCEWRTYDEISKKIFQYDSILFISNNNKQ